MEENKDLNIQNGMPEVPNGNPGVVPAVPVEGMPVVEPPVMPDSSSVEAPIAPTEVSAENVATPVPDATNGMLVAEVPNDMDNSTFDYNRLYGDVAPQQNMDPVESMDIPVDPAMEQAPIVLGEEKKVKEPEKESNIIPTFDTSVLEEDIPEELRPKKEEKLISTITSETQEEKAQNRRNLFFLIAFFGVLIVAVLLIFPLMTRY